MSPTQYKLTFGSTGIALSLFLSLPGLASAQPVESVAVNHCFLTPAALNQDEMTDFIAAPKKILGADGSDILRLSTRIRAIAGTNMEGVDAILTLVPDTTEPQAAAIGTGLGRAARACVVANAEYASDIVEKVAALDNEALLVAFAAAAGDQATAALGGRGNGGAAGGAPGIAGLSGDGANSGAIGGDESVATTAETYSVSRRYYAALGGGQSDPRSVSPSTP